MGKPFQVFNNKPSTGPSSIPMIGSTSNSYAVLLELSSMITFSAVPSTGIALIVMMEIVVRTTSSTQQVGWFP
jgi:hypothetical protein